MSAKLVKVIAATAVALPLGLLAAPVASAGPISTAAAPSFTAAPPPPPPPPHVSICIPLGSFVFCFG